MRKRALLHWSLIAFLVGLASCTTQTRGPTFPTPTSRLPTPPLIVPSPTAFLAQGLAIHADKDTLSPGETVTLSAVDSAGRSLCSDTLAYYWSVSGRGELTLPDGSEYIFLNPLNACKVSFILEAQPVVGEWLAPTYQTLGTAPILLRITLMVRPAEQPVFDVSQSYEKAVKVLRIVYPSSVYFHFVLDASGRMNEVGQSGVTLLEEAKKAIVAKVATVREDINVGLRKFGPETDPGSSKLCLNTDLVLDFTPRGTAPYQTALNSISAAGTPPLLSAIRQGIRDIVTKLPGSSPVPNPPPAIDPYHLTVYTGVQGGLDQCTAYTLVEQLKAIKDEAGDRVDITIYLIARVTNDQDAERLKALSERLYVSTGIPFWPYPVGSTGQSFTEVLDSILRLSSANVLEAYQASLDLNLNVEAVLQARVAYEGAIGDYEAALADLERLQAEFPDSTKTEEYWYLRGITLANLLRWEDSADAFASAIALKADYAPAYYGQGIALTNLGQFNEAQDSFSNAYALKSNLLQFGSPAAPGFVTSESLFKPDITVVNPFFLSDPNFYFIVTLP